MTTPIFQLQNASKQYGDLAALRDVTLRIERGERVALVGPSGAGKSTLLQLLNGALIPDEGTVTALGHNLSRLSPRRLRAMQREIGVIYQQFHLVGNLRVIHNVNAGHLGRWSLLRAALSLARPAQVEQAREALARVGIPEKLFERTDRLSGGQQQRVALARALVQDPQAILADEPIASLDPEHSRRIMELLSNLSQEMGKTLVVSLHAVAFAFSHCDRLVGLRQGRVLFDAAPS
ncbi:MAG: phosphonate ABC transporter ATP-binding protein, partial [bacterium]